MGKKKIMKEFLGAYNALPFLQSGQKKYHYQAFLCAVCVRCKGRHDKRGSSLYKDFSFARRIWYNMVRK